MGQSCEYDADSFRIASGKTSTREQKNGSQHFNIFKHRHW